MELLLRVAAVPAVDPETAQRIGPGFAGFVTMFLLAVATLLLIRNMVGHLRKIRYSPDPAHPEASATRVGGAGDGSLGQDNSDGSLGQDNSDGSGTAGG